MSFAVAVAMSAQPVWLARPLDAKVQLNYFNAVWIESSNQNVVELTWETATELDVSGFQVERATSPTGNYQPFEDFVPATGDETMGVDYGPYYDMAVAVGPTYWYRLVVYDRNRIADSSYPPVAVPTVSNPTPTSTHSPTTPAGESRPTLTFTPSPASTEAPTETPMATLVNTPTVALTNTSAPGPITTLTRTPTITPINTSTPMRTPTPTSTDMPTATKTLAPAQQSARASSAPQSTAAAVASLSASPSQPRPMGISSTLAPTEARPIAMVPVVVTESESSKLISHNDAPSSLFALIGVAIVLLLGGLYIILRSASK